MTQIVNTEAVVLKAMKYRETSTIASFYTKQFGKVSGIVKGARRAKSKYGSALQPMSYVALVLYKKDNRDLQTVSQCDLIKSFRHLSEDIEKMAIGMSMIELTANVAHEEEENPPLFSLLVGSLQAVNDATKSVANLLYHFELRLATVLGFQPRFDDCISCRSPVAQEHNAEGGVTYHLGRGGPLCANCSAVPGPLKRLSMRNLRILKDIAACDTIDRVLEIEVDYRAKEEINGVLWDYLRHHVSGMRSLKSHHVFSQILDAS